MPGLKVAELPSRGASAGYEHINKTTLCVCIKLRGLKEQRNRAERAALRGKYIYGWIYMWLCSCWIARHMMFLHVF